MKRLLTLTAVAATALTITAAPATAASGPNVFTAQEVKTAYGVKVKGSAQNIDGVHVPVSCKKETVFRLKKGKEAVYNSTGDSYFTVVSASYQTKSAGSAKTLVRKVSKQVTCLKTLKVPGTRTTVTKGSMPKLGNQRVAYQARTVSTTPGVDVASTTTFYIVRKKSTVVVFGVSSMETPTHGTDHKMIKKAVKRA